MDKVKQLITKPEINFWLPIIVTIVSIAISWSASAAKIDRLTEKNDLLEKRVEAHIVLAEATWNKRDDEYTMIQVKLAEIQKELVYLNEKLTR